jgi:hypothetical protein
VTLVKRTTGEDHDSLVYTDEKEAETVARLLTAYHREVKGVAAITGGYAVVYVPFVDTREVREAG